MFLAPFFVPDHAVAQSANKSPKAATELEVLTYVNISIATFCEARDLKIEFPKSLRIAVATQGYPIYSKHGGLVPGATKPLPQKQFIGNASFMVVGGALKLCPNAVPAAEKKKFEDSVAARKKSKN